MHREGFSLVLMVVLLQTSHGVDRACRPASGPCSKTNPLTSICTHCESGYYLTAGNTCALCSSTMNECATCVSSSQCTSCSPTTTSSSPTITTCTGSSPYSPYCKSVCEATSLCETCAVYTDDPKFLDCRCNVNIIFKCNFESSACLVQSGSDDTNWIRLTGPTPSTGTGPSAAMCSSNYYFYMEASEFFKNDNNKGSGKGNNKNQPGGEIAIVFTSTLNYIGTACLRFGLHMFGQNMGSLTVKIAGMPDLLTISGDQGNAWKDIVQQITLTSVTDKVEFKGVIGTDYQSDISIDNVLITPGGCTSLSPTCADTNCNNCSPNTNVCTECVYGYYDTASCKSCRATMPYCDECSDGSACTTCENTFSFVQSRCRRNCDASLPNCLYCSDTSMTVCEVCPSGFIIDNISNCTACTTLFGSYCLNCSDAITCTQCADTFTFLQSRCRKVCDASLPNCVYCDDSNDMTCAQCPTGYAIDNSNNCTACNDLMPNCAECSDTSTCTLCENTFTYIDSRCRKTCNATLPNCVYCDDMSDMVCQKCVSNQYAIDSNNNCTDCGSLMPYCVECSNSTNCTQCENTFSFIDSRCRKTCNATVPNCLYCDDTDDMLCQKCTSGYTTDANNSCTACSDGFCDQCSPDPYICTDCVYGYYDTSNCTACSAVTPYCEDCSEVPTCTTCQNTFMLLQSKCKKICDASLPNCIYCNDTDDTVCENCLTGFLLMNNDNCTACSSLLSNCAQCSNDTTCDVCQNTFADIQSRCRKICDPSLPNCVYCDDASDMLCQQCVSNRYTIDINNNCTACGSLISNCAECSNTTNCTQCETTFADIQSRCRKICDPSLPNCVYCDDTSDMICQQCVSNMYALDINNNCTACNQLMPYCAECSNTTNCTACESTFTYIQSRCRKTCDASLPNCVYCADTNDTDCQQCLPGYTLFHGNCYECTDGNCNSCPVNPNVCTNCDYGYYDTAMCTACNTSMPFCANCTDGSNCTTCEDTFFLLDTQCRKTCDANILHCVYCNESDSSYCEDCVYGIRVNGQCMSFCDVTVVNCTNCTIQNSSICETCSPGFELQNDQCAVPVSFSRLSADAAATTASQGLNWTYIAIGIVGGIIVLHGLLALIVYLAKRRPKGNAVDNRSSSPISYVDDDRASTPDYTASYSSARAHTRDSIFTMERQNTIPPQTFNNKVTKENSFVKDQLKNRIKSGKSRSAPSDATPLLQVPTGSKDLTPIENKATNSSKGKGDDKPRNKNGKIDIAPADKGTMGTIDENATYDKVSNDGSDDTQNEQPKPKSDRKLSIPKIIKKGDKVMLGPKQPASAENRQFIYSPEN